MHKYCCKIYYEDTDAGGIVYHSNYLKYAERARSDLLQEMGFSNKTLLQRHLGLVVRRAEVDFKKPARLEDVLTVETTIDKVAGASCLLTQTVRKDTEELVLLKIQIVMIDTRTLSPARLPVDVKAKLEEKREEK
jgi:acyl-CoA thioester hydrolase